jgi:K+/H+ antiporter YhaU regulatory subunit KhtT
MREHTGCRMIAVGRAGEVIMNIPTSCVLSEEDALYICGTLDAFDRFRREFSG